MPIGTLRMGQIENLPGPQSFPLWPGQVATVVKGHHLRTNQYLMGRVYDDEAAKANWDKSVVKSATGDEGKAAKNTLGLDKDSLVTGQLIVIRGTNVAFYIPPTGVEVLMDEDRKYVRDAVTLERLEFSILLDENGNKEYLTGPAVVFPKPTQTFFTKKALASSVRLNFNRRPAFTSRSSLTTKKTAKNSPLVRKSSLPAKTLPSTILVKSIRSSLTAATRNRSQSQFLVAKAVMSWIV